MAASNAVAAQTLPTIAASPPPPLPTMSDALQASINKWAGTSEVNVTIKPALEQQTIATPQLSVNGFSSGRVSLSPPQMELLQELTAPASLEKDEPTYQKEEMLQLQQQLLRQATGKGHSLTYNAQEANRVGYNPISNSRRAPRPFTSYGPPNLTRCAVSLVEVDRLRRENQSIQLMQERAMQGRMQEQVYLHQRNIAASALVSMQCDGGQAGTQEQLNQIQLDALNRMKKLSSTELNSLSGSVKSSKTLSSFRKRRSLNQDEDDSICSKGSHTTHTHSMSSASSSHKIHRSRSHCSAHAALKNLRVKSRASFLGDSNRNESFSSGLNVRPSSNSSGLNMKNQSFSPGSYSARPHASQATLTRSSSSNNWIKSLLSEQTSAGNAAAAFQLSVKNSSNGLVSLLQNQSSPSPKAQEEVVLSKPVQVQATEYGPPAITRPRSTSNETVIISAVPDRIKYQSAHTDTKPIDIVKEALSSRGAKCDTKPSMDMEGDFFLKVTEMYDTEIVNAIRSNDVENLRKLHAKGINLQCGNRFGETLIHLACRRSHRDVVSFLVNEVGVSLRVRDDMGRTPWHDACWRTEPDLDLLDLLLDQAPELLMLSDKRGHTPLDYARRQHWAVLVPFLLERKDKFRPV